MINPIDREELRDRIRRAEPFPHCPIDNFLDPDFAREVCAAFPKYEDARRLGAGSKLPMPSVSAGD